MHCRVMGPTSTKSTTSFEILYHFYFLVDCYESHVCRCFNHDVSNFHQTLQSSTDLCSLRPPQRSTRVALKGKHLIKKCLAYLVNYYFGVCLCVFLDGNVLEMK